MLTDLELFESSRVIVCMGNENVKMRITWREWRRVLDAWQRYLDLQTEKKALKAINEKKYHR